MEHPSHPPEPAASNWTAAARRHGATVATNSTRNTAAVAGPPVPNEGTPPRVVTTGGKNTTEAADAPKAHAGFDSETGEPFDVYQRGRGVQVVRHLVPALAASPAVALIDALAFTVLPPDPNRTWPWLVDEMRRFLPVEGLQARRGCFGFKESAMFGEGAGLIAWGGKSQRGRVYFSIQGKGCAMVSDWDALAEWLRAHGATLKRTDLAHDDFTGRVVSIAWAQAQYEADGFNAGGRKPKHSVYGDWLSGDEATHGRTLGIGNRTSGKYCRIYEKGRQLGDPASTWTRIEVEWRGKDRVIPLEILTRPGTYLAGAYPCLAFLDAEQSRIKTIANAATVSYERAVENAKQQTGKLVNLMLQVNGGDYVEVVEQLKRDGIPGRIEAYSYHLGETPELLDRNAPGGFGQFLTTD